MVSPEAGARVPNGARFLTVGSEGVSRVVYSSDGHVFGSSDKRGEHFPVAHTFSQTGLRKIKVEGFDAQGQPIALTEQDITVLP